MPGRRDTGQLDTGQLDRGQRDTGLGPLGVIDHAYLAPGLLVPMHEHRNDEIFSYVRSGTMYHKDSTGQQLPITPTQLVVMNAGSGI